MQMQKNMVSVGTVLKICNVVKLYRARPLQHQYYFDCSVPNCDSDALVLIQLSDHTFAWTCGKHYCRWQVKKKFCLGS